MSLSPTVARQPHVASSNLVVLRGVVTNDPVERQLPDGTTVVSFDVVTRADDQRVSVPVAWHEPAASARRSATAGADLVVVGTVRRRFFRVGGATQSRTEVVAERVVPARRTKTVRAVLAAVSATLAGSS